MEWTDDPLHDFANYDAEQEEQLDKLPKCDCCNEPIQDDFYFDIEGNIFCEDCMNKEFRKDVEDYGC